MHFFKNACPIIPNSILELFFDVSPAQVSIVNTRRDVYVDVDWTDFDMEGEIPTMGAQMSIAQNMCFSLGYSGISNGNNNVPQIRNPRGSELNDEQFSVFKQTMLESFEKGYLAMSEDSGGAMFSSAITEAQDEQARINEQILERRERRRESSARERRERQARERSASGSMQDEVSQMSDQDLANYLSIDMSEFVTLDRQSVLERVRREMGMQGEETTVTVNRGRVTEVVEETTDASVRNSSNTFYYIGYQNANSGSLYNRSSEIKKFPITTSDDKVNVFYFAMLDEETDDRTGEAIDLVYYYQLQWGNTRVDGGAENQEQITTVAQLQSYFKNNTSRLSTPDTLNLFRLNGVDANTQTTIEALSKKAQSFELLPSVAPTYFTSTPNGSTQFNLRSDEKIVSVNRMFKQILGSIDTLRASRQATVSNTPLLTNAKLKTLAKKTYSKPFGLEIEGFDRFNTRLSFTKGMRERGNKIYATIAYKSKIPINGEEPYVDDAIWRVEADTSVRGADARGGSSDRSGVQNTMEIVSVILNQEENNSWIKPLEHFLTSAQAEGFLIDPSAGTHVHCGFALYDARQTANLFINTTLIRPVLLGLVSEAWKDRYYAMSRDISLDVLKEVNTLGNTNTQRDVVREYSGAQGQNRYSLMSLQNFPNGQSPTFEYRFQQSSVEKDTVINTVKILQRIWLASMKGVIPIKKGSGKSQDIVIKDLLGEDLYTYARNRYAETSLAPVRRGSTSSDNAFMGYNFPMGANEI